MTAPDADLQAENARLREALKPFADFVDFESLANKTPIRMEWLNGKRITIGDLRRARAALNAPDAKEK